MNSLRISIVQYLNTAPLVRGFTHGALREKYQLSFTVPSQCADALRVNAADIAIIPAIEYPRIPNLVVLPGLSIASKRAVRSLLLVSRKPVREVTRIALDRSSRSTQALVRILCRKWWSIAPGFIEAEPDLSRDAAEIRCRAFDRRPRAAAGAQCRTARGARSRRRAAVFRGIRRLIQESRRCICTTWSRNGAR